MDTPVPDDAHVATLGATSTAYLQLPGGWFRNNAGWITGRDHNVLVDTCATETRSRRLLDAFRDHTNDTEHRPLTAVITHAHGDHANGAGLITRAGGKVLASAPAAREIAAGPHTYPSVFHYTNWGDITPPPITDTIADHRRLDLGGQIVDVLRVPGRAHTDGDLVVWAARDGVLFTGDLLFNGVVPLAFSGSVTGWLTALDWLEQFDAQHVVPGHGPLTTLPEARRAVGDYLRWLLDATEPDHTPNYTALEAEARTRWPHWLDGERHAVNLRIAHAEIHGVEGDPNAAFAAMLASAGGVIHLDL